MSGSTSATTAVPAAYLSSAGFVAPSEQEILAGAQADITAAMGGNLNQGLSTPQGQIAVSETAIIGDCNDAMLALFNGVDPQTASGAMQDAIGYIYFQTRNPATYTTVNGVLLLGTAGAVVPAGALIAQDTAGNTYAPQAAVTIGSGGTATCTLVCTVSGPVPCDAGALSLYQSVSGVSGVNNAQEGVIGSNIESRSAFEARRAATVEGNSIGSNAAILGSLLSAEGVTDAYVVDNPQSSAQTIGGVSIAANSVYCVVAGGQATGIGLAIIQKKPPGCAYTGGTSVSVQDPNAAYGGNGPTYSVSFDYANATPIYIAVTMTNSTGVPSNATALVQQAVINAFTGTDGGSRARIGAKLYASRYMAGIVGLGAWAQVVEIQIGTSANPSAWTAQLNINQVPTIADSNITLTLA